MSKTIIPSDASVMNIETLNHMQWFDDAFYCLKLTLHYDYLSNSKGHQQTRAVMNDRAAPRAVLGQRGSIAQKNRNKRQAEDSHLSDHERSYLSFIASQKRLTSSEEYTLACQMKSADVQLAQRAESAMVQANLGLVVMFAQRYRRPNIPLMDLMAEGNFGLMTAAKRFDPERGYRFSTYAKWWVRQAIQQSLPKLSSVIRVPLSEMYKENLLQNELNADSSDEFSESAPFGASASSASNTELAEALISNTHSADSASHASKALIFCDDSHLENIAIEQHAEPPNQLMHTQLFSSLEAVLLQLSEREQSIISERYALANEQSSTLSELSVKFNVSVERIRQIESAALKKLNKLLKLSGVNADSMTMLSR